MPNQIYVIVVTEKLLLMETVRHAGVRQIRQIYLSLLFAVKRTFLFKIQMKNILHSVNLK